MLHVISRDACLSGLAWFLPLQREHPDTSSEEEEVEQKKKKKEKKKKK